MLTEDLATSGAAETIEILILMNNDIAKIWVFIFKTTLTCLVLSACSPVAVTEVSTPTNSENISTSGSPTLEESASTFDPNATSNATKEMESLTILETTATNVHTVTPPATHLPTPTALLPTIINTPLPFPTSTPIPCNSSGFLPEKEMPVELDLRFSRTATDKSFLYFAAQQFVGVFDISVYETPKFLGFWKVPEIAKIYSIKAQNGIVYVAGDSTLLMLNESPECQFQILTKIDFPFQIFHLEVEHNRLYVGGTTDSEIRKIGILSIEQGQLREQGSIELGMESAAWSVFNETIYALVGNQLIYIETSDLARLSPQTVPLPLDMEAILFSPSDVVEDSLYLLLQDFGGYKLTIVSDIKSGNPTITQDPLAYFFGTSSIFKVQDNFIFIGNNSCDVDCISSVTIADSSDGHEIFSFGLQIQAPIFNYLKMSESLFYAFSTDALLVLDTTNQKSVNIINEEQFLP